MPNNCSMTGRDAIRPIAFLSGRLLSFQEVRMREQPSARWNVEDRQRFERAAPPESLAERMRGKAVRWHKVNTRWESGWIGRSPLERFDTVFYHDLPDEWAENVVSDLILVRPRFIKRPI